ncbi:MAG: hypothetical protein MI922_13905 [Bacteroidales bacterium]|nr:hypothetical protein [Bacteroidales bacterium]
MLTMFLFRVGKYEVKYRDFVLLCSLIHVFTAWFSVGHYNADEHYQVFEFAYYKLGYLGLDKLPWDYHEQIKPGLLPGVVFVIYRFFELLGIANPFIVAFFARLVAASLSILSAHLLTQVYASQIKSEIFRRWLVILTYLLWFLVFVNVRLTSEGVSGSLFAIAFCLPLLNRGKVTYHYFLSGFVLGLSFVVRFQIAFMILGFGMWLLYQRKPFVPIAMMFFGGVLSIASSGLLIDRWFYGEWSLAVWNNVNMNIIHDVAAGFGSDPFWYYLNLGFMEGIPPFSLVYIASLIVFSVFMYKSEVTWAVIPYLLVHSVIGHKETRYLFPILPLLPVIIIYSLEIVQQKWIPNITDKKAFKFSVKLFAIMNAVGLLLVVFKPADDLVPMLRTIYRKYPEKTTLYYSDDHPYENFPIDTIFTDTFYFDTLYINFYKRENLICEEVSSGNDVPSNLNGKAIFVCTKWIEPGQLPENFEPIYTRFPQWVKHLNFNNWMSRTSFWQAYEVKPKGN